MICKEHSIAEIIAGIDIFPALDTWSKRIGHLQPKNVLELGTGQGASGVLISAALPAESTFTTIDNYYNDGGDSNPRFKHVHADTLNKTTLDHVPDGVDLMFIDTTHEAWHAAAELCLWQDKLVDGAIVIVDDLPHNDMRMFWDSLPYDKGPPEAMLGQGIFRYDTSRRYAVVFPRRNG